MPDAAPRVCARCNQLAPAGEPCSCRPAWEHSPQRAARGQRWTRTRRNKLRTHPICEWPDCRRIAVTVDHIVPLAEHGDQYARLNLQSLCREHDIEKTAADARRGKTRRRGQGG